ncbi:MAG: choice-of-anchor Q domain-containing protein, partial [Isosphaeraceae bacterium]
REAIRYAGMLAGDAVVTFDPALSGRLVLGPLSQIVVDERLGTVTIDGGGVITLDAQGRGRALSVEERTTATLTRLTITGGRSLEGAAIKNAGTLTLDRVNLRDNTTNTGQVTDSSGAIHNLGTLTLRSSTVAGNTGSGGIFNVGTLTVATSRFLDNRSDAGGGGAIGNGERGTLTVSDSTFARNAANGGGAVANHGRATIVQSTFEGNSAGHAGAIRNEGTLAISFSTIVGNTAGIGGGIFARETASGIYRLELDHCILDNPSGGNLVVGPSTVFTSRGHNLFSDAPSVALDPTDLIDTDPMLSPLGDHGGPTPTLALLPGSPAIDAGGPVEGRTTDQRGVPRPQGARADIGAFESRGFTLVVAGGAGQSATANQPFSTPLTVRVVGADGEPVAGGRVAFEAPASGPSAVLDSAIATIGTDGRAAAVAVANGVLGAYTVNARVDGVGTVAFALANVPAPPAAEPPRVLGWGRQGVHWWPTTLRLTFSRPLDPASAQDTANYAIVPVDHLGRALRRAWPIAVARANYDPVTLAVTLSPSRRLGLHLSYRLTVSATAAGGVRGADGLFLDGRGDGMAGTDYATVLHGLGTVGTPHPTARPAVLRFWRPGRAGR